MDEGKYGRVTLRDRFAMAALPGLITESDPVASHGEILWRDIAEQAYGCADAMLEARDK